MSKKCQKFGHDFAYPIGHHAQVEHYARLNHMPK